MLSLKAISALPVLLGSFCLQSSYPLKKKLRRREGGPALCCIGKRLPHPCHHMVEGHPFLPVSVRSNIHSQVWNSQLSHWWGPSDLPALCHSLIPLAECCADCLTRLWPNIGFIIGLLLLLKNLFFLLLFLKRIYCPFWSTFCKRIWKCSGSHLHSCFTGVYVTQGVEELQDLLNAPAGNWCWRLSLCTPALFWFLDYNCCLQNFVRIWPDLTQSVISMHSEKNILVYVV